MRDIQAKWFVLVLVEGRVYLLDSPAPTVPGAGWAVSEFHIPQVRDSLKRLLACDLESCRTEKEKMTLLEMYLDFVEKIEAQCKRLSAKGLINRHQASIIGYERVDTQIKILRAKRARKEQ